jgi:hypothetical protein
VIVVIITVDVHSTGKNVKKGWNFIIKSEWIHLNTSQHSNQIHQRKEDISWYLKSMYLDVPKTYIVYFVRVESCGFSLKIQQKTHISYFGVGQSNWSKEYKYNIDRVCVYVYYHITHYSQSILVMEINKV